jgi:hypothetical protein
VQIGLEMDAQAEEGSGRSERELDKLTQGKRLTLGHELPVNAEQEEGKKVTSA